MKVAIIGAGASGLTAIKCCIDEGIRPVCFEKQDDIGGLWKFVPGKKDGATVYGSTVINTSKEMMCFSDFPIPKEFPNFMHNSKVYDYFKLYQERFHLEEFIRFNIVVLSCEQADGFEKNGHWKITTKNLKTNELKSEYYDGVLVCVGHHAIPYYPLQCFPGITDFKGKHTHSHSYRDHKGYENLRVVVVGIGNSGGDIAVELSRHSKQVYLSTRRGAWVLHRVHDNGLPLDINMTNRFMSSLQKLFPTSIVERFSESQLNKRFNHAKYGLKPKHAVFSQHPNVCDDLPNRIITGSICIKSNVERFTETTAVFDDGTEEEVDAVIFATGYSFAFPFLDESILKVEENECELYKHMWPTTVKKHTLAIIGGIQPLGAVNPISEMQCRWATRVIKDVCELPPVSVMRNEVKEQKLAMRKRYIRSRRHTLQVDYVDYMDQIASKIHCKPNIWKYMFTDPALASKVLFGPAVPYQYRLEGPGRWPEARQMVMTVMDRVEYPFKSRKVEQEKSQSSLMSIMMLVFLAVLLSWFFNLI